MKIKQLFPCAVALLALLVVIVPTATAASGDSLTNAREATAAYNDPSGMFNPWNPQVTCGGPTTAETNQMMDDMPAGTP